MAIFVSFFRLFFAVHVQLPIIFACSKFKKRYYNHTYLPNASLKYRFKKNIFGIYIIVHWLERLTTQKFTFSTINKAFYLPLLWTLQDACIDQKYDFESLLKGIKNDLKNQVENKDKFEQMIVKVLNAQVESIKQQGQKLTIYEIADITAQKAGNAILLFAAALDLVLTPEVEKIVFDFGVLAQLIDDILDVHEDSLHEISTLANALSLHEFEIYFSENVESFFAQIANEKYSETFRALSASVIMVGYVQLHQLKKLPHQQYAKLDRKQCICDMQKCNNVLHLFKLVYRYV